MKITVWRIVQEKLAAGAFDGEGARRTSGRWNPKGVRMIYAAGALSLAALEILVHIDKPEILSDRYTTISVDFDSSLCLFLDRKDLPPDWQNDPAPDSTRKIGAAWIADMRSAVLAVPSAIIPLEWNYLLNPNHPDFKRLRIGKPRNFTFDPRLINT